MINTGHTDTSGYLTITTVVQRLTKGRLADSEFFFEFLPVGLPQYDEMFFICHNSEIFRKSTIC